MNKWISVCLMLIALLSLVSCAEQEPSLPDRAVPVYYPSGDITYIVPGEYPEAYTGDPEVFKFGYNVYVSKTNNGDKLILSGNRIEGLESTSGTTAATYFRSGDWRGLEEGVFLGAEKVIDEECVGMVASMSGDTLLILTNTKDNSYVYSAQLVNEEWKLDAAGRLELGSQTKLIYYNWPLYPYMTHDPAETMYLVTENDLIILSVGDHLDGITDFASMSKTVAETPEYWEHLRPTGAVAWNDKLYFGDMFGVVEYDASAQAFTYYPVDLRAKK